MGKYKRRMVALNLIIVSLLVARSTNQLSEQTAPPPINFVQQPSDLSLDMCYEGSDWTPIFLCKVSDLMDGQNVAWFHNDTIIPTDSSSYTVTGNHSDGQFNLVIQRNLVRSNNLDYYDCAVSYFSETRNKTLWYHSRKAKLHVHFWYTPATNNPTCAIHGSTASKSYNQGAGFTLTCCSKAVDTTLQLVWLRDGATSGVTQLASKNASSRTDGYQDACLVHDVTDHHGGDSYRCRLAVPPVPEEIRMNGSNKCSTVTQVYSCGPHSRNVKLVRQTTGNDRITATFTCYSPGAVEYLWDFDPQLDKSKNQYHINEEGSTVLLNVDVVNNAEYNMTCTAVGGNSIGSMSNTIEIRQNDSSIDIIRIIAIVLGISVFILLVLLIVYIIKTRLSIKNHHVHAGNITAQQMRTRVPIRRNLSANTSGIYAFPSTRSGSSSITPLIEGPEDTVLSPEVPTAPRPGVRPCFPEEQPQEAVGGVIVDEDDMIECEYEQDPKTMNVEGLQYADLEFSEDEDDVIVGDNDGSSDSEEETDKLGKKPQINYADIVHFDPRRNSDPRRKNSSLEFP